MSDEENQIENEPIVGDDDVAVPESEVTHVDLSAPMVQESTIEIPSPEPEPVQSAPVEEVKKDKTYQIKLRYSYPTVGWSDEKITINLPTASEKDTREALEQLPNMDYSGNEKMADWANVLNEGNDNLTSYGQYESTLNDEKADFSQGVDYKGKNLGITELKTNFSGTQLSGEKALIAFNKAMGYGDLVQTPLWSSGFWITFKTPTEADMISLNTEISEDKIRQGRATKGLVFTNRMSYTLERLSRFAMEHIFDTTLDARVLETKDIRELIKVQDYPFLIWGLLCSMYPRGFQYSRSCISDPDKCNYVLQETLNLKNLAWVNWRALDESHLAHMSNRMPKTKNLDSIINYQNTLSHNSDKTIDVQGEEDSTPIRITFKTPNISEYIASGEEWIVGIISIVDELMSKGPDSISGKANEVSEKIIQEKNKLIDQYAQASSLRQLSHWVKNIEFQENSIEDKDTLNNVLSLISQDDKKRVKIIDELSSYIDETTIAVIGIPNYNCPKCKEIQQTPADGDVFGNIIPLDVTTIFFDQFVQRMVKVSMR